MPITIKLYTHTHRHTHQTTYNKLIGISKHCCCRCLIAKSCLTLLGILAGKSHRKRSLVSYSPWGCKRVRHNIVTKQKQISKYKFSGTTTLQYCNHPGRHNEEVSSCSCTQNHHEWEQQ